MIPPENNTPNSVPPQSKATDTTGIVQQPADAQSAASKKPTDTKPADAKSTDTKSTDAQSAKTEESPLDRIQDTAQAGFSRFDETARKAADEAAEMADDATDQADAYMHQGMASLNKAGTAIAGAIAQRPFVSLLIAAVGGAMVAVARRR